MWRGETYRHRKKRVGFLSADFREHPVGYLLVGLIENLDSQRIETYGFSCGIRDGSELYRRYRNAFDHYLDCKDKTSHEIARLMRAMEIDVAIDLSGYTAGSRLEVLSHRPCPAQATYLGFPGGLNLPYIDYLIADRVTVPEEMQKYYREKLLYLPHCYLPRDTSVRPSEITPNREDFGLPSDGAVFCSFNHDYKITPGLFTVWMDLLRENPKSVLWLMKLNEDAQGNLAKSADACGVDPARLIFATRVPRIEDHLARYRLADVCLDTFPYNGHTTTSDALLAGLPVVSIAGRGFASRVASSLLADQASHQAVVGSLEAYKSAVQVIINAPDKYVKSIQPPAWISAQQQASELTDIVLEIA
jgi:predicted O-linked N-acetylglucosamine transferase (SPINDLY family)